VRRRRQRAARAPREAAHSASAETLLPRSVLNKITPEKFDRLMEQLLDLGINSAEALKDTISLIFDKVCRVVVLQHAQLLTCAWQAIWEPTFCPLYAEMCVSLSKALPEFPPVEGEDKPLTFRRVLLNTCQEEFEGAAQARAALESITSAPEREAAERKVKLRTLGNIRLIGELYKAKMIVERILHSCIGELLGKPKTDPPEENIEALVNLLVTVGKELDASPRSQTFMEAYFARLLQLSTSKKLASRLRFLCRDIIDLRKNNWVPRREKLQAKKLDQVRADAAVALGIVKPQDENLFPEGPNGPGEDGWSVAGKKNKSKADEGYSALTGQYVPSASTRNPTERPKREPKAAKPAEEAAAAEPAQEEPAPRAEGKAAAAKKVVKLTAEELPEQCSKLFAEYKSAADLKEALLCVLDIQKRAPEAAAATELVCVLAVQDVIDDSSDRCAEQMTKLLAYLAENGAVSAEALQAALGKQLAQLDDLAIDVPMAPKLLGTILGGLVASKAVEAAYLRTGCEKVEDMLYRRDLAVRYRVMDIAACLRADASALFIAPLQVAALLHIKSLGSPPLLKLTVDVPLKDFLTSACFACLLRVVSN
jgi:translation initiation factor 4G